MKCLELMFVALLSFRWQPVLSKSYSVEHTDLLELSDNDEFLWGAAENEQHVQANNNSDGADVSSFLSRHRLTKRQAPAQSGSALLVSIEKSLKKIF
ncbi:GH23895 [Drosophila grimshawi]|uniref:GH23895 n=1 Tax=Drosophila grimshawi TaxID=7222 RepID=B4K2V9_DROGR|nr:GH23895 [Drosophila grimshawi]